MTADSKIKNALSDLVGGRIWANACPLEEPPDEWLVFYHVNDTPDDHGDDVDLIWTNMMAVHWVKKGNVNHHRIMHEIRNRLREAGFSIGSCTPFYDEDVNKTHLIVNCSIIEEAYE